MLQGSRRMHGAVQGLLTVATYAEGQGGAGGGEQTGPCCSPPGHGHAAFQAVSASLSGTRPAPALLQPTAPGSAPYRWAAGSAILTVLYTHVAASGEGCSHIACIQKRGAFEIGVKDVCVCT